MDQPEPPQRFFRSALIASFALLVYMFLPFFGVLLTVCVLVVVTWPMYARLARSVGNVAGAVLTTVLLFVLIVGPTSALVWLGIRQAAESTQELLVYVSAGGIERSIQGLQEQFPAVRPLLARLPQVEVWTEELLQTAAREAGSFLTSAVQILAEGSVGLAVALASMIALYLEGPKLLANTRRIGLLSEEYLDQLFETFQQFATNVIVGMFATTTSQGLVAAFGFWLAGVERVTLLGFLTAVLSQVPIVGSAVVWVPVTVQLAVEGRYVSALFVAVWSVALTASVDNLLKPLVYGTGLQVHPILVLLALLAGLTTFGPGGVLVGPLAVVMFVTLWTLYDRDVLSVNR
jgi:predicted PurR-regulated permease PerM